MGKNLKKSKKVRSYKTSKEVKGVFFKLTICWYDMYILYIQYHNMELTLYSIRSQRLPMFFWRCKMDQNGKYMSAGENLLWNQRSLRWKYRFFLWTPSFLMCWVFRPWNIWNLAWLALKGWEAQRLRRVDLKKKIRRIKRTKFKTTNRPNTERLSLGHVDHW